MTPIEALRIGLEVYLIIVVANTFFPGSTVLHVLYLQVVTGVIWLNVVVLSAAVYICSWFASSSFFFSNSKQDAVSLHLIDTPHLNGNSISIISNYLW